MHRYQDLSIVHETRSFTQDVTLNDKNASGCVFRTGKESAVKNENFRQANRRHEKS
jgi:hypothetical protein